jgi:rod shape-determining protein MreC
MPEKKHFPLKFRFGEFLFIFLILLSGTALAFSSGSFLLDFKKIGFTTLSTISKGVHFVTDGISDTFNAFSELKQVKKDYNELLTKLENYEKMQRSNVEIRKENERLKEQLDFSLSLDEKNIPSQIISRNIDTVFSCMTINKGSINGIKKNMPVVAYQNGNQGLVGKVIQVGPFTSEIMPIYNSDCIISARIQNTRDIGLVNGSGNEEIPLEMNYIRKRVVDELNFGDIIVTSGENDNYTKDIVIGSISQISVLDYNSSLNIQITPILDFSKLETVVVINQKELNDKKQN